MAQVSSAHDKFVKEKRALESQERPETRWVAGDGSVGKAQAQGLIQISRIIVKPRPGACVVILSLQLQGEAETGEPTGTPCGAS